MTRAKDKEPPAPRQPKPQPAPAPAGMPGGVKFSDWASI